VRRKKDMSKKIVVVLALVVVIAVGGWLYWRRTCCAPPPQLRGSASLPLQPSAPTGPTGSASARPETSFTPGSNAGNEIVPGREPGYLPRAGETFQYVANVTKLNSTIATIKIVVAERQNFDGKSAWHLQAFAHTENPYRMVFELDDQFDSYSDAANSVGLQYEMHLNERGQKLESVQRMLPSASDPTPADATAARVLPGTRDPLGMLQYLRGVDWSKVPEVRSPVYDGHALHEVRATLAGKNQQVKVPAGSFTTSKIEIRVFDNGGENKDSHFFLYLTNDSARMPVLMEAVLPVATARVELTKAS
jgi:hypothetical protein